jgi:putative ABC transport system permease protein
MNNQTLIQNSYHYLLNPRQLMTGVFYALIIGAVGGLLPAIRAARLPIPSALREL